MNTTDGYFYCGECDSIQPASHFGSLVTRSSGWPDGPYPTGCFPCESCGGALAPGEFCPCEMLRARRLRRYAPKGDDALMARRSLLRRMAPAPANGVQALHRIWLRREAPV